MVTSQVIIMVIVSTEISLYSFAFPEQTLKPGGTPKPSGTPKPGTTGKGGESIFIKFCHQRLQVEEMPEELKACLQSLQMGFP